MTNYTVDTDGTSGDYSSLDAAITALGSTGFSDDVTISCEASTSVADTSAVDMSDINTTASYRLNIISGDDNYSLSVNLASEAVSSAVVCSDISTYKNITIAIPLNTSGMDANYEGSLYFIHAYGDIIFDGIKIVEASNVYRGRSIHVGCDSATYGGSYAIKNCCVVCGSSSTDSRSTPLSLANTPDLLVVNNTWVGDATGLPASYRDTSGTGDSSATFTNNLYYNCDAANGGPPNESSYNLTNRSWDWGGTGDDQGVTFTFDDAGSDDYHLDSTDTGAIDEGIGPGSDSNVPTADADGNTRSGTTCDVGAYEYQAGGTAYTMPADSGTYTETGTAALLLMGYAVDAGAGSFTETGTAAGLLQGFVIDAGTGSYSETGTSAGLFQGFAIDAEAGSLTLTGSDATLQYGANTSITAESGTFTETGTDAGLYKGYAIDAGAGSIVFTGSDATLTYASAREITAESGTYTATGTSTDLLKTWKLSAEAGSFIETGTDTALNYGLAINAETGAFIETGADVDFSRSYLISADAGSIAYTGYDVTLTFAEAFIPIERITINGAITMRYTVNGGVTQRLTIGGKI